MSSDHIREHIEIAIDRARERVSDRIDEIDTRLRGNLDVQKLAGDHAPQLLATGAVFGLLLGLGVPKVVLRSIQIGVPLWLAVRIVKARAGSPHERPYAVPDPEVETETPPHGDPLA